jgi:hypothetical protein
MRGTTVLAVLPKGAGLEVGRLEGDWIAAHVTVDGDRKAGWVKKIDISLEVDGP